MYKINYPDIGTTERDNLKKEYYDCLNKKNKVAIDRHLLNITHTPALTFEMLVRMEFDELSRIIPLLDNYNSLPTLAKVKKNSNSKVLITEFEKLFDYAANQQSIATFFMQQSCFNLKVCNYCGIDYINAFADFDKDYLSPLDFVNHATKHDLMLVPYIKSKRANKIIANRIYTSVDGIGGETSAHFYIKKFEFVNSHNSFTLDHIYAQKTHRFLALCLFNFVPCCYACNAKFKKEKPFLYNSTLPTVSPTAEQFSASDDFEFKIYYNGHFKTIKAAKHFQLLKDIKRNDIQLENYFTIFKLMGRYAAHKDKLLPIIEKKVNYPERRLIELSHLTGISIHELRSMIFGKELFDKDEVGTPLLKLKRDIARNIKVKGVVPL